MPGQGQSVNVAGVKVGEVGDVKLENGHAVVTMQIQNKYKPIYHDATVLMRPKTGLKDMYLALDPGTKQAGALPEGGHVTVSEHAARRERRRGAGPARRRHARLPRDPAQRRRDRLRRPRDRRRQALPADGRAGPARGLQALRADRALRRPDHQPADRAAAQHHARDPQLPAALDGAGQARRPDRRLRGLRQQELRDVRLRGVVAARGSAQFPSTLAQTTTTLQKTEKLAASSGRRSSGCGRSPASWRRRCARRVRSSGRRRRSSRSRSGPSRATSSRLCATSARPPRSWRRPRRA